MRPIKTVKKVFQVFLKMSWNKRNISPVNSGLFYFGNLTRWWLKNWRHEPAFHARAGLSESACRPGMDAPVVSTWNILRMIRGFTPYMHLFSHHFDYFVFFCSFIVSITLLIMPPPVRYKSYGGYFTASETFLYVAYWDIIIYALYDIKNFCKKMLTMFCLCVIIIEH